MAPVKSVGRKAGHRSTADALVQCAVGTMELFHDGGDPFSSLEVDGHRETLGIGSLQLMRKLILAHYEASGESPSPAALRQVVATLDAIAMAPSAPEIPVYRRVATVVDKLYVDFADRHWQCIEIDSAGWRVVSEEPRFVRSSGTRALPVPEHTTARDGVMHLKELLSLNRDDFLAVLDWMLAALRDTGPYPVLVLLGEHGTARRPPQR